MNRGERDILLCENATRKDKARLFVELTADGLAESSPRNSSSALFPTRKRTPQLNAFFTSAPILASSAEVNFFSANAVGHMAPSSRFAWSLKPNVAYLALNLCAPWKKQTTLPSLAYAGIPYQVLGERGGALAWMMAWEPFGHGAIRFQHLGNLREHVAFPVRLVRVRTSARGRLQLFHALP